jgi:predicted small metal-binding protein
MALCSCVRVLARWGKRGKEKAKVRTLECPCGIRLEARNDEELAREVLTHAREEHDASDLTEEQTREMVASHAQGTEDAS